MKRYQRNSKIGLSNIVPPNFHTIVCLSSGRISKRILALTVASNSLHFWPTTAILSLKTVVSLHIVGLQRTSKTCIPRHSITSQEVSVRCPEVKLTRIQTIPVAVDCMLHVSTTLKALGQS